MFKKFMSKKRNKKRGFTLIELIIVIAIIAILAAIAVPAFGKIREKANVSADIGNARSIYSVVTSLVADETITLPNNGTAANTDRNSYTYYDLTKVGTNSQDLSDNLAGVSKPKAYQGTEFLVGLNGNGDVKIIVMADDKGTASKITVNGSIEIYPTPQDRYGSN